MALYRKRQMIIMLPETDPRGAQTLLLRYQAMFPAKRAAPDLLGAVLPQRRFEYRDDAQLAAGIIRKTLFRTCQGLPPNPV